MKVRVLLLLLLLAAAASGQDAGAWFSQGVGAYAAEDYERAMSLFEQAIKAQPEAARYHHWFGKAAGRRAERVIFFRAMGLAKKVREAFERAVELDPTNIPALADLLEFYLQAPGIVGGGEDKARGIAARLARLSPAEGHRAQALILAKRKDYAGAEKEFRRALELEPNKLGRLLELASFLDERGRHGEADTLFERAGQMQPDSPEYLFARGKRLALSRRNPELARDLLGRYMRSARSPDDPPASEVKELLKKI